MDWGALDSVPRVLVRSASGRAALWLDADGNLRDALGPVRVYEGDAAAADLDPAELSVFVAEWVSCAGQRDGAVAIRDVHPDLRVLVYELTPSAILVTDEDALDILR